jgi:flagellar protein FliJ
MKARDATIRIKRFEADEHSKKVANLQYMIRDFEAMAADLDRQIQAEEDRTGIKDITHFAYSTFAKSATQRRKNLRASTAELTVKLEAAVKERDAAVEGLSDANNATPRETLRSRRTKADRNVSAVAR